MNDDEQKSLQKILVALFAVVKLIRFLLGLRKKGKKKKKPV